MTLRLPLLLLLSLHCIAAAGEVRAQAAPAPATVPEPTGQGTGASTTPGGPTPPSGPGSLANPTTHPATGTLANPTTPSTGTGPSPGKSLRVEVDAPPQLRPLLERNLDAVRLAPMAATAEQLQRLIDGVAVDARALLATEGYFAAVATVQTVTTDAAIVVRLAVVPGPRSSVRRVGIVFAGALGSEALTAEADRLRSAWHLTPGQPFRQVAWDDAKGALLRSLIVDRFAFAQVVASRAEVDPEAAAVDLSIEIDSGPALRFGAIRVEGLRRYPETIVTNLRNFNPGERYRQDRLLDFQTRVQSSGYFESALASLDTAPGADGTVTVVVTVTEVPYQQVRLGVGFSTDTRERAQADYTQHAFLGRNLRLHAGVKLDTVRQSGLFEVIAPPDTKEYSYSVTANLKRETSQGLETRTASIAVGRTRKLERIDSSLFAQYLYEDRRVAGAEGDSTRVAVLGYSWTYRDVDSLLLPSRGYLLHAEASVGGRLGSLSQANFVRARVRGAVFVPVGSGTLIARGEAGQVLARSRDGIPDEFLFRAGGDQSIRGYELNELGVREGDATVGGRYVGIGSIEYIHPVLPDWGAAVFVDAGNAADSFRDLKPVYGYGAGARWRSPVGSIALDLARAQETGKVRIHLSLGFTF